MRVLVTGGSGQLGRALAASSADVLALPRAALDIADAGSVARAVEHARPDVVVHAAAMTDVDGCERDPDAAQRANVEGTRLVAAATARAGARLLYIGTNFVFDGAATRPYVEDDPPRPISVYGATKLAGEQLALAVPGAAVVRTAWVYGEGKRNFVTSLLARAEPGASLRYLDDEVSSPTYAADLAAAIVRLCAAQPAPTGVFHLTNAGCASALEWAREVLDAASRRDCVLAGAPASSFPRPAARPRNGALANTRAARLYGLTLRPWQEAVRAYVASLLAGAPG
jgi:dTDP-4-dehydrorhamnose reductase